MIEGMDPVSLTAAAIVGIVDWKALAGKIASDAVTDAAKAGRKNLLQRLQPDARQKAAKQAVELFTEEFLKELDDKCPLTAAIPGYHLQLQRLIEPAAVDIASWLEPEIKTVDLSPVARMWTGLNLDPLPEDFDWQLVAQNYGRAIRQHIKQDAELRAQLAIALQEDSHSFDQRFAPGLDLAGYRDFLQKKCALLQLSAVHTSTYDRRVTLWGVFVPQSARESAPARDIPRELLRQLRREGQLTGDHGEERVAELRETYNTSPISPVLELLDRQPLVVLLGDPGSGKTSLLKYLVLRWATQGQGHLPLWVDLKEYAQQPIGLKQYLESGLTAFGLDARSVDEQCRSGEAALYLDGLDEIFHAPTHNAVIEQIAVFTARYSRTPVVVTSRIVGYEPERLRNAGFTHATLEDFDDEQVLAFLRNWHDVAEDDPKERTRLQARLKLAIDESRAIRELAGNPLLLTMMAILNRNQELPRDRVELYREASRVLLHEWDASRSLLSADTFARQEKEALLRELAGAMQQTEGGLAGNLIERQALIGIVRKFLANLGIQDSYVKAESLVHQLTERNFILCSAGADCFAFVHRTFLEYFCAAWFVEQLQKQLTLSLDQLRRDVFGRHWYDRRWHEVLRLIAGMVSEKQAGELIDFLMGLDGRADKLANLMLAAGCLSEVRNRRPIEQIDQMLLKRLIEDAIVYDPPYYYEPWDVSNETGPTRAQTVGLISSVWRSTVARSRLGLLASVSQDWIVRRAAVQELARGWKDDPDTLPWVKVCARSGKFKDVRWTLVEELARGWKDDPDTLPLLKDRVLSDESYEVRSVAVRELARGWKDDPDTLPLLKDCARSDRSYAVRRAAVQELARGWKDDPDTFPLLKERACSDSDTAVRMAAVKGLARGSKDDPDTLPLLKHLARSDRRYAVRIAAVRELARGWKDDPDTLPFLKDWGRSDENSDVRMMALQELARGWKDDPDTLPWLKDRARSDENPAVRMMAVRELARGWKDDPDTGDLLKDRARSDPDNDVRRTAVQELARGWKDDPDTLLSVKDRARSDENSAVRVTAARELARGWKDDPDTLPLLKERARSDIDNDVRMMVVQELARGWKDDPEVIAIVKDAWS
jgi:predicted NACHT family NTPase